MESMHCNGLQNHTSESISDSVKIALPQELYDLRHRYPAVLKYLLLECQRCSQWIPVEVLQCSSSSDVNAASSQCDAPLPHVEPRLSSEQTTEWHSQRLREKYKDKEVNRGVEVGNTQSEAEPDRSDHKLIPNPVSFVCNGIMCQKGDHLVALRAEWLHGLEEAVKGEAGQGTATSDCVSRESRVQLKSMISSKLSKELEIRRSKRLENRKKTGEELPGDAEDNSLNRRGKWVRGVTKRLMDDEAAMVSAFCWVVCDACGKIRRTAQPFPGGAPFVCCLSVARSCHVSEADGIREYNKAYHGRTLERIDLTAPFPLASFTAERYIEQEVTSKYLEDSISDGYCNEPTLCKVSKRWNSGKNASEQTSMEEIFLLLKDVTAAIRRKSIRALVKRVVLNPEEIRKKREQVMKSLFTESSKDLQASTSAEYVDATPAKSCNVDMAIEPSAPGRKRKCTQGIEKPQQKISSDQQRGSLSFQTADAPSTKRKKTGRHRKPKSHDDDQMIFWIQCDKCDKWRIVPEQDPPEFWECSMRPGTTCDDDDEATSEES